MESISFFIVVQEFIAMVIAFVFISITIFYCEGKRKNK